jgi:hypothetical protein
MEIATKLLVGRRVADGLEHHAQGIKQRKGTNAQTSGASNALDCGVGWLVGPANDPNFVINCIACTEYTDKEMVEKGAVDILANPPNWEEEAKFVSSALPQGLTPLGIYVCFIDESKEEQREEILGQFFRKNAQSLQTIFTSKSALVAVKALHPTEEQEEAHSRPTFYHLTLVFLLLFIIIPLLL